MGDLFKDIFAVIGMIAVVGLGLIYVLDLNGKEKIQAECAEKYRTMEFKTVDGKTFCQAGDGNWYPLSTK